MFSTNRIKDDQKNNFLGSFCMKIQWESDSDLSALLLLSFGALIRAGFLSERLERIPETFGLGFKNEVEIECSSFQDSSETLPRRW